MGVALTLPEPSKWTFSLDPANFGMSKIYQGNFQSSCGLAQLFLDTSAVILQKRAKSLEEIFFQL